MINNLRKITKFVFSGLLAFSILPAMTSTVKANGNTTARYTKLDGYGLRINYDDGKVYTRENSIFSGWEVDDNPGVHYYCLEPDVTAGATLAGRGTTTTEAIVGPEMAKKLNLGAYLVETDADLTAGLTKEQVEAAMQPWIWTTVKPGSVETGTVNVAAGANDDGMGRVFHQGTDVTTIHMWRSWIDGSTVYTRNSSREITTGYFSDGGQVQKADGELEGVSIRRIEGTDRADVQRRAEREIQRVATVELNVSGIVDTVAHVEEIKETETKPNTYLGSFDRFTNYTTVQVTSPQFLRTFIDKMNTKLRKLELSLNASGIEIDPEYQKDLIGRTVSYNLTSTGELTVDEYLAYTSYPRSKPAEVNIDTTGDGVNDTYLWIEGHSIKVEGTARSKDGRFTIELDNAIKDFQYPEGQRNRYALEANQRLSPLDASQISKYKNDLRFDIEFIKNGHIEFNKTSVDKDLLTAGFENAQNSVFKIFKDEALTQEITVNNAATPTAIDGTVNANGVVSIRDLLAVDTQTGNPAVYYIKEFSTLEPHVLNTKVYKATMVPNETVGITNLDGSALDNTVVNDAVRGQIRLEKVDNAIRTPQGNATLAGAQYRIKRIAGPNYYNNNVTAEEVVAIADDNGRFIVQSSDRLPLGTYEISEIQASKGYRLDTNKYTVELVYVNQEQKLVFVEKEVPQDVQRGTIEITKFKEAFEDTISGDGSQLTPESGVIFEIINISANPVFVNGTKYEVNEVVDTITTGNTGFAKSAELPYGLYKVQQKKTEASIKVVAPFEVFVAEHNDNEVHKFNYKNVVEKSYLQLVKKDETTKQTILQSGVSFKLYKQEQGGEPVVLRERAMIHANGYKDYDTFTTLENGTVTFPEFLEFGTYYLEEIASPEGYYLDPNGARIKIDITGQWTLVELKVDQKDVINTPQTGTLSINKYGDVITSWNKENKEVEVQLEASTTKVEKEKVEPVNLLLESVVAGRTTTENVSTDDKGQYVFTTAVNGQYRVLDTNGVELATLTVEDNQEGTMTVQGIVPTEKEVYVEGQYESRSLEVNKAVYTNERLAGAKFELVAEEDVMSYDKQTKYFSAGDKLPIAQSDISVNGEVVYKKGDVITFPQLSTDQMADKTLVDYSITTISEDATLVNNIPLGKYVYREIMSPSGFKLDETVRNVEFTPQVREIKVDLKQTDKINNERQILNVVVDKKSIEKAPDLRGINFVVKNKTELSGLPADSIVGVATPNESGVFTFEDLPQGEYYVEEWSTKDGYVLSDKVIEITLTGTENAKEDKVETVKTEIVNKPVITKVVVKKIDKETQEAIADVKFVIEGGRYTKEVIEMTTDVDGNIVLMLVDGSYDIIEKEAPRGYVSSNGHISIVVKKGANTEYVITNEKTKVSIRKVDMSTGEYVSGVRLQITNLDGTPVLHENGVVKYDGTGEPLVFTTTDSDFIVSGLEIDKEYILTELAHKEGYLPALAPLHFNVRNIAGVQVVSLENERVPSIGTTATINDDTTKEAYNNTVIVLKDKVSYIDLAPGKTYTGTLVWMDKNTGEPFMVDGKPLETKYEFVAETKDGFIVVEQPVDSKYFTSTTELVAFEKVYREGRLVGAHEDITDEGQTVKVIVPKIATTATVDGNKSVDPNGIITIIDRIDTRELTIPGVYEFVTKLVNKSTGEFIKDASGNVIEVKSKVEIVKGQEFVEIPIQFDSSLYPNTQVVVYEWVYDSNGVLITEHADINDEGQTITINPKRVIPKTNDNIFVYMGLLISSVLFGTLLVNRRRKTEN